MTINSDHGQASRLYFKGFFAERPVNNLVDEITALETHIKLLISKYNNLQHEILPLERNVLSLESQLQDAIKAEVLSSSKCSSRFHEQHCNDTTEADSKKSKLRAALDVAETKLSGKENELHALLNEIDDMKNRRSLLNEQLTSGTQNDENRCHELLLK